MKPRVGEIRFSQEGDTNYQVGLVVGWRAEHDPDNFPVVTITFMHLRSEPITPPAQKIVEPEKVQKGIPTRRKLRKLGSAKKE